VRAGELKGQVHPVDNTSRVRSRAPRASCPPPEAKIRSMSATNRALRRR